jgi:hypothetical protein
VGGVITVVCAADGCSNTFTPNRRGRPRLYCDDCSTGAAYNRRWRKGETHSPPSRPNVRRLPREAVCESCGESYTQTAPRQLYCGREGCGELVAATCEWCGQPFEARARDREKGFGRFHSKSCALQARQRNAWRNAAGQFRVAA